MEKLVNNLMKYIKKFDSEIYSKLRKIKDKKELEHAVKYTLISVLEKEFHKLEREINSMEKKGKDVFFAKTKILNLPAKIKFIKAEYCKDEIDKVINLLNDIKEEIKCLIH